MTDRLFDNHRYYSRPFIPNVNKYDARLQVVSIEIYQSSHHFKRKLTKIEKSIDRIKYQVHLQCLILRKIVR